MAHVRRISATIVSTFLLVVLQSCSSGHSAGLVPPMRSAASTSQCTPDFSFTVSPTSVTITAGQTVTVGFGMTSLCGLAGTINVGVIGISPKPATVCSGHGSKQTCTTNGPTLHQCCYDFPLPAGASTGNRITVGATAVTVKTTYTITVRGQDITGGCCYGLSHSATFTVTVT